MKAKEYLKKIILLLIGIYTAITCLGGIFTIPLILWQSNFQHGKLIVIFIFLFLIIILGLISFKCFKTIFQDRNKKHNLEIDNHPMTETFAQSAENTLCPADERPISDEKMPFLIQVGNERALERENAKQNKRMAVGKHSSAECSRLINDSYKILSDTADPDTFCRRFNFIKNKIDELNGLHLSGKLENSFPVDGYNALISTKNVKTLLFRCYYKYYNKATKELKTKKGIEHRITKFWKIIQENLDHETLKHLND